ncbi:MAG: ATP-binding protein [Bacteroidetes bacterium]|nr:ATP-binding protein [Bacteroidota bacterium]
MYKRLIEKEITESLKKAPVTAILGPRQCGKSTIAKKITKHLKGSIYLDLERPSDLAKLENAEWFFMQNKAKLICIDEIQRKPDLFPLLRSIVDDSNKHGQFLILGSATNTLLNQSSESLAGRIAYYKLTPFLQSEVNTDYSQEDLLVRGGFPRSVLAKTLNDSIVWRENFITTYLERDLLQWVGTNSITMRKIWQMLAHYNGQTVNYSGLGNSLGVSNVTIKNYIDLLTGTYMVTAVKPYTNNLGKRLVKAPKIYISDTGIAAALLGLSNFNEIAGHPSMGALWEAFVLANITGHFPKAEISFYRTAHGDEMDFILCNKRKIIAIECKTNVTPVLSKGAFRCINDISPIKTIVIAPVNKAWEYDKNIIITPLPKALKLIKQLFS